MTGTKYIGMDVHKESISIAVMNSVGEFTEQRLVSLVSVWGRNWCYLCGTVEGVETGGIIEIGSIHAGFMHVAEKMVG
jgi:hypothetical protein